LGRCQENVLLAVRAAELVARNKSDYDQRMKTLTVQEASDSLSDWLHRAVRGEQIAIHEGNCTVLLQPVPQPEPGNARRLSPREALGELQSRSQLTLAAAEKYLGEIRDERLADGGRNRQ
jgi:antitoxin (DNA-binding transcriptional repressor) of toxin-antitoxin stability system